MTGVTVPALASLVCTALLGYAQWMRTALILLAVMSLSVHGNEVYKWTDPDGNVIYSDVPHPDAEIIDELEPQTYQAPELPPGVLTPTPKKAEPFSYKEVAIATPQDDENMRSNAGMVEVTISLSPPLQTAMGHKLVLLLDGQQQAGTGMRFQLTNVDRGTHTLTAQVVDGEGNVVTSSAASTFHLQRSVVRRGGGG